MKRIASFSVDHTKLKRGLYVSRVDSVGGDYVTTFDIRMKEPNKEPVIDVPALHTIEHIGATFLRNHAEWDSKTVYFGPMGCRTGCYVLFKGKLESADVAEIIKEMFAFIAGFEGDIPGSTAVECGNYLSQDLPIAKYEANKYLTEVLNVLGPETMNYPDHITVKGNTQ